MSAADHTTGSLYIQEIVQLREQLRAREAWIVGLAVALREQLRPNTVFGPAVNDDLAWKILRGVEADNLVPKGFCEGRAL